MDCLTKCCGRCGQEKPLSDFYFSKTRNKPTSYCKLCQSAAALAWFGTHKKPKLARTEAELKQRRYESVRRWITKNAANTAQQRAWQQAYKDRDPERARQQRAASKNRKRFKELGREHSFSWLDWLVVLQVFENKCAFCGAVECFLDLEHIVSAWEGGHHIVGNVVPACRPCNAQKNKRTITKFAELRGIPSERVHEILQLAKCESIALGGE